LHCTLALSVFICPWGTMYYNNTPPTGVWDRAPRKSYPTLPSPKPPKSLQKKSRSKTQRF